MSDLSIPSNPQHLTAEWLTDALRSSGTIKDAAVTSFDMEPDIAAGVGFMGQLARISPTYDRAESGAPASIIGKFPAPAPENREIAQLFRFYEIETRFYEQIAGEVDLQTPKRYYSNIDLESGDFVLLLEDLAPAKVADQVAGCTPEQAELAIRELAKFHATWWENPRMDELKWMWAFNNPVRAKASQQSYQQAWGPFVENFGKAVPSEILEIGERFGEKMIGILNQLAAKPRTISHGDYRLDNLFFGTPEGGAPITVIDWQIMSIGRGAFDFAYFMTGTLPPAERKAKENDLLKMYHDILVDRGVKDYSFDQLWEDYRVSTLFCWLYAVIVLGTMDIANERGLALFTANLERNVAALTDLKAGDLLPD